MIENNINDWMTKFPNTNFMIITPENNIYTFYVSNQLTDELASGVFLFNQYGLDLVNSDLMKNPKEYFINDQPDISGQTVQVVNANNLYLSLSFVFLENYILAHCFCLPSYNVFKFYNKEDDITRVGYQDIDYFVKQYIDNHRKIYH